MKQTVYTWLVKYTYKGQNRTSDGGPYLSHAGAESAAEKAMAELCERHGRANVHSATIREHQAPISQPAFA